MAAHKSTVNDISFDEAVEYIASCSDDGTVVVRGLGHSLSLQGAEGLKAEGLSWPDRLYGADSRLLH